jgi:deoxyribodipyrimidine photo-lyase
VNLFEPSLAAAHEQLARFRPDTYARTRNQIDGVVSRLSPYLTHGFLSMAGVFRAIDERTSLDDAHKFVFELGWRAYFRHVWNFLGDGIHRSIHQGPLPEHGYSLHMPEDVVTGCTGIAVIDASVRELYGTGYLHNHARMWLASYLVHVRKVHWHCGAQWLLSHLIDGDVASNHLSWQWVAGTSSVKPYLFNADNVAKFAPPEWHSFQTAIDVSYQAMHSIAYGHAPAPPAPAAGRAAALMVPRMDARPADPAWRTCEGVLTSGRTVCLVHPWSLGAAPHGLPADTLFVGVALAECHASMPWSERRWQFVTRGMKERSAHLWWGDVEQIARALASADAIHWSADAHVDPMLARIGARLKAANWPGSIVTHREPELFDPVESYCPSFSQWWRRTRLRR